MAAGNTGRNEMVRGLESYAQRGRAALSGGESEDSAAEEDEASTTAARAARAVQDRREAEQSWAEADAAAEEAVADGERVSAELGEIREAHQVLEETFAAAGRAHAQLVEQLVGEREKATAGEERRGPELPRQPKPASAARAEGVRVVAELRTELAELRQQHREELDTLRVEDRAERDELRAEHREQLADVRAIARTAEQRATEQHQRADRAEALVAPAERPRQ